MKLLTVLLLSVLLVSPCIAGPAWFPLFTGRFDVIDGSWYAANILSGSLTHIKSAYGKQPIGFGYRYYYVYIHILRFGMMAHKCGVTIERFGPGTWMYHHHACFPPL